MGPLLILCPMSLSLEKDVSNQSTMLGDVGRMKIPYSQICFRGSEDECMHFERRMKKGCVMEAPSIVNTECWIGIIDFMRTKYI